MSPDPWPAPAKLNLFLHVIGRRPDGYHELQTAFQLIDLCDSLAIEVCTGRAITRLEGPPTVPEADDLSLRAARLLQAEGSVEAGARLRLIKRIPIAGGLGGGSSDAATALVALNALWGLDFECERLAILGRSLGADVPLFIHGLSAFGEGVGERLTPLELPERHFAIIHPGIAVRTADVFHAIELTRDSPRTTIRGFLQAGGHNDCEPVVAGRYPEVARALAWLSARGDARLTGTGSCVFAAFGTRDAAAAALADLPAGWSAWVARGLKRSPLQERLAAERASRVGGKV